MAGNYKSRFKRYKRNLRWKSTMRKHGAYPMNPRDYFEDDAPEWEDALDMAPGELGPIIPHPQCAGQGCEECGGSGVMTMHGDVWNHEGMEAPHRLAPRELAEGNDPHPGSVPGLWQGQNDVPFVHPEKIPPLRYQG